MRQCSHATESHAITFFSRDDNSLQELGGAAQDVTKALNDLLNHIKDGGPDKIPDIMDQIMVASGELIASNDSQDMVRQARILAQATAELIQSIKGDAESQTDSDLQVNITLIFLIPKSRFYIFQIMNNFCPKENRKLTRFGFNHGLIYLLGSNIQ